MVGIVAAMQFEERLLVEMFDLENEYEEYGINFSLGKINNISVVIAACGEGKVNAARCAQIMICVFGVTSIINIGVAGSLVSYVKKGDIVIAENTVQHDYDMTSIGVPRGLVPCGIKSNANPWGDQAAVFNKCSDILIDMLCSYLKKKSLRFHLGNIATGDIFIADKKIKQRILSCFDVIACEMEGASIAYVCKCADVAFAEVRTISDNADSMANDNYFMYQHKYNLSQIVYDILFECEKDKI